MRRKRKFRTRRRVDEQLHPIPKSSSSTHLQTALRAGLFTPDVIMRLQQTVGNQAVIQRLDNESDSPTKAQSEAEKRLKEIMASLNADKKKDKGDSDAYKKALEAALKALMATKTGKDLKKRVISSATKDENLPLSIVIVSGIIAGMFAKNVGIPAIPDIPVGDGMTVNVELDGTMQSPSGIKFTFTYKFGGSGKSQQKRKSTDVPELPPALLEEMKKVDKKTLQKWILDRAFKEYQTAAPDQKPAEKTIYEELKADSDGLPEAHLVIEALARALLEKPGEKRIEFDLQYAPVWDSFSSLEGLLDILKEFVEMIVPTLPEAAQDIEQITFKCGKKLIPIPVKRPEKEPE